jgi:hypothetical protein
MKEKERRKGERNERNGYLAIHKEKDPYSIRASTISMPFCG